MVNSRVSFIVVNFNGGAMLSECLKSIQAQTIQAYEVIVVDNGSTDGSCDLPLFQEDNWRLLSLEHNTGFANANNEAFRVSSGTFIALVNNDIVLSPTWAEAMIAAFDDPQRRIGSVACRILQKEKPELLDSAGFRFFSCGTTSSWCDRSEHIFADKEHRPFGAVASAAMYHRTAIETTGLFHKEYFCYYEDTDLAVRLVLFGFDTAYADKATACHVGSFTGKARSHFHIFHLRRNIEYLYWIDMVGSLAWRYLLSHLIYECFAFFGAIVEGRAITVMKAKVDFVRHLSWVKTKRWELRSRLDESEGIKVAQKRLEEKMCGWVKR